MTTTQSIRIEPATEKDIPLILTFIKALAEYERLSDQCVATEALLRETLFGEKKFAETVIAYYENTPAGFEIFFHNFSTFLARPGIYLEGPFRSSEFPRERNWKSAPCLSCAHCEGKKLRPLRMGCAGLECAVDRVL